MTKMRAKVRVGYVKQFTDAEGKVVQEEVTFFAVGKTPYPEDGSDENNTFAKWSPQAKFEINIANPALFGKYEVGQEHYVDFAPALQPISFPA